MISIVGASDAILHASFGMFRELNTQRKIKRELGILMMLPIV